MSDRDQQLKDLLDVDKYMPAQSREALEYFVELNPNFKGAQWPDVLDNLYESDSHCDLTDAMWEECQPYVTIEESHLIPYITFTLTYAHRGAPALPQHILYWVGYITARRENAKAD